MEAADTTRFSLETLFAGGRLCLDFINTSCEIRGQELEFLKSGDDLYKWLRSAEAVYGRQLVGNDKKWSTQEGEVALTEALALREVLHDLAESVAQKKPAPVSALEKLNSTLRAFPTCSQIELADGGFAEAISISNANHAWLAAIAQDAVDLLCYSDLSLLRQCECPTCVRFFFDTTKNHRRRWCVEKCGSAPKAAAYYRRKVARKAQQS